MFYKRLNGHRQPNETDSAFARRLGVSRAVFLSWKKGKHLPKVENFKKIRQVLKIDEKQFWCDCQNCKK